MGSEWAEKSITTSPCTSDGNFFNSFLILSEKACSTHVTILYANCLVQWHLYETRMCGPSINCRPSHFGWFAIKMTIDGIETTASSGTWVLWILCKSYGSLYPIPTSMIVNRGIHTVYVWLTSPSGLASPQWEDEHNETQHKIYEELWS